MSETLAVMARPSGNDLAKALDSSRLTPAQNQWIFDAFAPFWVKAQQAIEDSASIAVSSAEDADAIEESGRAREALKTIRTAADRTRKDMKEESLRVGQGIQNAYNAVLKLIEPAETRLREQEEFIERQEDERRAKLKAARDAEMIALGADITGMDTGNMHESQYKMIVVGLKAAKAERIAAEAKSAEEKRLADLAHAAEQQRIRDENARLKAEADEKDRLAKIERDRVAAEQKAKDDAARKEREAYEAQVAEEKAEADRKSQAAQAEIKALADRERELAAEALRKEQDERRRLEAVALAAQAEVDRKIAEEAEAMRKAEAAPDKEKLLAFANQIMTIVPPHLATGRLQHVVKTVIDDLAALATKIIDYADSI